MNDRYQALKSSECEHKRTIAEAIAVAQNRKNEIADEIKNDYQILMGCFAIGSKPELYIMNAKRVLAYFSGLERKAN